VSGSNRESDPRARFIKASVWHGTLDDSKAILAAHKQIASSDIYTAAILGDDAAVRRCLARDPASATRPGPPLGWDALTHLCFSRYLRLDGARSARFVRAAKALLDAGASANSGFHEADHRPEPEWESVLYGAAGVAHHAPLTRLLLERGADPNDEETAYHAPETMDNAALKLLVESGRINADSLATMLLRKADWHDAAGQRWLLGHGADPNRMTPWRYTALHQALRRDNALANIEVMVKHGADPAVINHVDGRSSVSLAAWRGRGDVLAAFERHTLPIALEGVEALIAACARSDRQTIRSISAAKPGLIAELVANGGTLLTEFAGTGNTAGVSHLLDLGVDVGARYAGDRYWGLASGSTALHVAAWRARHQTVALLIERGAALDARDDEGRTALMLAVRATVDAYWSDRRSPASVRALLRAGASTRGVAVPSGYGKVDALLKAHQP
jgi:ankyrin repeat protein